MNDNEAHYRVTTSRGYYFTTANGRYGRVEGRNIFDGLCKPHAEEIAAFLNEQTSELNAAVQEIKKPGACLRCQRTKTK